MRLSCKYKGYSKITQTFDGFSKRVFKFKKTKWKKIQRLLFRVLNKKKRYKSFIDKFSVRIRYKTWDKIKNYYNNGNSLKNILFNSYDKSISISSFYFFLKNPSTSLTIRQMYLNCILKPKFRLDILMWKLSFFRSSYEARQAINEKKIFVNKKIILGNYFVSKGDIITFTNKFKLKHFNLESIQKNTCIADTFLSFVEVDFYSNTIVILKSLNDLSTDDFNILINKPYNLKKIKDYI